MTTQRLVRFALIPLTAVVLIAALLFLTMRNPSPATAADLPEWQQAGNTPMTHTMPMTETQSPMSGHQMHEGMAGMGQGMMNHAPAGMGEQMVSMGRRMQMMGMMMQMMGHMHNMHGQMHGQMQGMMNHEMPMMQGMMGQAMPMTHTMPMTDGMGMGGGMGMMDGMMEMPMMDGMMDMPMMDMGAMHGMMSQMMDTMMAEMHAMHQMMGMGQGAMDHGAMNQDEANHNPAQHEAMKPGAPMTHTMPAAGATGVTPADLTQTAQAGAVEIVATALNLTDAEAATIDFEIALNSHSVTIDLDLVNTAVLQVGEVEIAPTVWETTTPSGHHIKGLLRFPRTTEDDEPLLAEATDVTLVIGGLPDDAERTFTWEIQ